MKKIGLFILGLCTTFFAYNFTFANDYEYSNLNITADILEDGTINVKENYKANFFVNKHGIIRTIPLNYSVGGTVYHVDISNIDVKGKTFTSNQYDKEREIKIGDADKTIIGEQNYPISYTVYGLIKNFSGMGYAELYWNLVGNDFDTNINKVKAILHLPKAYTGFTSSDFLITSDGKTESVEDFEGKVDWSLGDRIIITYDKGLPAFQGITLAIKFPNNYFEFDHEKQKGLIGRAKYDYSEYANSDSISNITHKSVEINFEQSISGQNSTEQNILESNYPSPEPIIEDSTQEQKIKESFVGITSNNYVSSGPKTKAQGNYEYEYTNLDIRADILKDGAMNVNEIFTADFHVNKHGIIRVIPLNYSVLGHSFHIDISKINVAGKKFSTSKVNGEIEIKIGDPDRTVVGKQTYPISYSTYGLIRNFSGEGYAELYWNLVGYDFETNINNVKAEIYLPKTYTGLSPEDFLITVDGKTTSIYEFQGLVDWKGGNKITITYDKGLSSYQGITLSIKFPNDYFEFDHKKQTKLIGKAGNSLFDNIGSSLWSSLLEIIGIVGFIGLFIYTFIKKLKDKSSKIDTKSGALSGEFADKFPVIVQYTPPQGLNSAEAGLLLHRGAKPKDMLSLIYKRATEGLIKLSFEEEEGGFFKKATKNVIITKIKDINPESPTYEKDFFRAIVHDEKSKITATTNLYNKLHLSKLESYGKKNGRFSGDKNKVGPLATFFVILFIFSKLFEDSLPRLSFLVFIGLFVLAIYSGIISKLKETEEGAKLISHILGYREFLAACDENKLRLFLQQDPLYFDKILPYAVAFGLDTELIKKIEPIMQEMNIKSNWYDGDIHYIHHINNTISSLAKNSVPPSYSSDSGFSGGSSFGGGFSSGGGGGGGGGRSW